MYTPNQQEKGGKRGGVGELRMRVEKTNDWIEHSTVFNHCLTDLKSSKWTNVNGFGLTFRRQERYRLGMCTR